MKEPLVGRKGAPEAIETDIQIGLREIVESIYGGGGPRSCQALMSADRISGRRTTLFSAAILSTSFTTAPDARP